MDRLEAVPSGLVHISKVFNKDIIKIIQIILPLIDKDIIRIHMLGMPIAFGSWWGLLVLLLITFTLLWRLFDEEDVLKKSLPGYREYMQRCRQAWSCEKPDSTIIRIFLQMFASQKNSTSEHSD
jgi:hypothetical protein